MMSKYKYLILRRIVQFSIMILFIGGFNFDWNILKGNYSTAEAFGLIYLSDPYTIMQAFASGFMPDIKVIIGAITITVFYFLLRGRMFCSWVCPMNIVTDAASWSRRKLKVKPLISAKSANRNIRFYVLGLGLVLSAIFGFAAFEVINPISMMHRAFIFGSFSGLFFVLFIFLFDIFILKHGFCGHICPVGAFYTILGKFGFLKVFHNQENCTNCMKCKPVCPEIQVLDIIGIESGNISQGACTNCGNCIDACNDNSLEFKITIK